MTGKEVRDYIENELGCETVHEVDALASAIEYTAAELNHCEFELMELLLHNKPIDAIHTHSYGFHTANGREIINQLQEKYYEYKSAS